ncbi:MAG: hypothetical protein AAF685_07225 [Cyanobacteria bacterium P01_C01_bin.89]
MTVIDRLFDEAYYLQANPDVAAAVAAGQIPSGRAHFLTSGVREGRTNISRFYRTFRLGNTPSGGDVEVEYLTANPDVAAAIAAGGLTTGLQHFVQSGEAEGRSLFPGTFDEGFYRRRYPDVAEAISQGVFTSGLEHYLGFGRGEQRSVSSLFELDYFNTNPDIRAVRDSGGIFLSAADHFLVLGRDEGRLATFSGTRGNDTVVGSAGIDTLTGIELDVINGQKVYDPSGGLRERDVLIGGPGVDTFELGIGPGNGTRAGRSFYQGNDEIDFARIENFEPGRDSIVLGTRNGGAGLAVSGTAFEATTEGINIIALNGPNANVPGVPNDRDLIAVVAGITNVNDVLGSTVFLGVEDPLLL